MYVCVFGDWPYRDCIEDGQLKLANGCSVPVIASSCALDAVPGKRNLDFKSGYVVDKEVLVLRDTGCELAAVRTDLVLKQQMLNKSYVMIAIDSQGRVVPTARFQVDTPFYT